ncbi:hypothetical protein CDD83_4977 [Cordyceps sp. RAO-2017]|nr:hypothetical protein CDD83_4977 [Cordyceps sp. RAO-2017]
MRIIKYPPGKVQMQSSGRWFIPDRDDTQPELCVEASRLRPSFTTASAEPPPRLLPPSVPRIRTRERIPTACRELARDTVSKEPAPDSVAACG